MKGVFARDIRLALSSINFLFVRMLFFLSVILVMPFGIGPSAPVLAATGAGVIWIATLLSVLLDLGGLFWNDREDGSLDIMILETDFVSLAFFVFIKCLAYWLVTALPLVLVSPFLALLLGLTTESIWTTMLALLIGTPAIVLIGSAGAALTVVLRRSGILLFVIVLPQIIPVLVFGVAASTDGATGTGFSEISLLFLLALTLFFSVLGPVAAASALKYASE